MREYCPTCGHKESICTYKCKRCGQLTSRATAELLSHRNSQSKTSSRVPTANPQNAQFGAHKLVLPVPACENQSEHLKATISNADSTELPQSAQLYPSTFLSVSAEPHANHCNERISINCCFTAIATALKCNGKELTKTRTPTEMRSEPESTKKRLLVSKENASMNEPTDKSEPPIHKAKVESGPEADSARHKIQPISHISQLLTSVAQNEGILMPPQRPASEIQPGESTQQDFLSTLSVHRSPPSVSASSQQKSDSRESTEEAAVGLLEYNHK